MLRLDEWLGVYGPVLVETAERLSHEDFEAAKGSG